MNIKILIKYLSCFIKREEKIHPLKIEIHPLKMEINPYNQKYK
jgi:hypothetical protein